MLELIEALHLRHLPDLRRHELTPVLFDVASGGDRVARRIVARQAEEIVLLACVALERLDLLAEPVPVVLGGGVLAARHPLLHDRVTQLLAERAPKAIPLVVTAPPVLGAALYALDRAEGQPRGLRTGAGAVGVGRGRRRELQRRAAGTCGGAPQMRARGGARVRGPGGGVGGCGRGREESGAAAGRASDEGARLGTQARRLAGRGLGGRGHGGGRGDGAGVGDGGMGAGGRGEVALPWGALPSPGGPPPPPTPPPDLRSCGLRSSMAHAARMGSAAQ